MFDVCNVMVNVFIRGTNWRLTIFYTYLFLAVPRCFFWREVNHTNLPSQFQWYLKEVETRNALLAKLAIQLQEYPIPCPARLHVPISRKPRVVSKNIRTKNTDKQQTNKKYIPDKNLLYLSPLRSGAKTLKLTRWTSSITVPGEDDIRQT